MGQETEFGSLYQKVEEVLADEISGGKLAAGDQLPTEDGLMARFGVSRITVRRAVANLVSRGLVEIRRGKGTFVAQKKLTQELTELSGFVEDMEALGKKASARVVARQVVLADEVVARQLGLMVGEMVMQIKRVRLADGVAMSFDETYLPMELGEKVARHDLAVEPIFKLLEEKYDVPLVEADYRLEAVTASVEVARALEVREGAAIFRIERTTYSRGDGRSSMRPVDYERLYYRGDLIRFTTRLMRAR